MCGADGPPNGPRLYGGSAGKFCHRLCRGGSLHMQQPGLLLDTLVGLLCFAGSVRVDSVNYCILYILYRMEPIRNRDGPFQWDPRAGIPPFQLPVATKHRHHTTRDQRRDIKMAARCGLTEHQIVRQMLSNGVNLTIRQVRYALQQPDTPKKHIGRPQVLTRDQREEL